MTLPSRVSSAVRVQRLSSTVTCLSWFVWFFAAFAAVSNAHAQRTFCVNGTVWERPADLPPTPAEQLGPAMSLMVSSRILFGSVRPTDQMIVPAAEASNCSRCHSERGSQWATHELMVFVPTADQPLFGGPRYEALLVRNTGHECDAPGSVLAGVPSVVGTRNHGTDEHIRFLVESRDLLRELANPETAPTLATPSP